MRLKTKPNFLSGLGLDRATHLRGDTTRMEREWLDPETRVVPIWHSKHIVVPGNPPALVFLPTSSIQVSSDEKTPPVFLGISQEGATFAADLSHLDDPLRLLGLDESHTLVSLREIGALLSHHEGALLAYANGIMTWHRRHRFCGSCGHPTVSTQAGHLRECRTEECGALHFPRTDPAVIVLVTDGENCLLGRQAAWPSKVYSTLAGFVEPGESLEEAAVREIGEETGIEVDRLRYHSSQPWPFPSSMMVGFTATAGSREIKLQRDELEDARWFTREELQERDGVELPSRISIARRLIDDWLSGVVEGSDVKR